MRVARAPFSFINEAYSAQWWVEKSKMSWWCFTCRGQHRTVANQLEKSKMSWWCFTCRGQHRTVANQFTSDNVSRLSRLSLRLEDGSVLDCTGTQSWWLGPWRSDLRAFAQGSHQNCLHWRWWASKKIDEHWWTWMKFDKHWWTWMKLDKHWWAGMKFDKHWWE
jgi:hypothetical protein